MSKRSQDPLGAGMYMFSGVRWIDPDNPIEAQQLVNDLACVMIHVSHSSIYCFQKRVRDCAFQLCEIVRRNRAEWGQTEWKRARRQHGQTSAALEAMEPTPSRNRDFG